MISKNNKDEKHSSAKLENLYPVLDSCRRRGGTTPFPIIYHSQPIHHHHYKPPLSLLQSTIHITKHKPYIRVPYLAKVR